MNEETGLTFKSNSDRSRKEYKLVVVDKNPDSAIVKKVSKLPMCKFNSHYVSDNLNHDVFTIYY